MRSTSAAASGVIRIVAIALFCHAAHAQQQPTVATTIRPPSATTPPASLAALPGESQARNWGTCVPVNVTLFSSRVHVKCRSTLVDPDTPADAILYFAYPTSDAAAVERVWSTLLTAQVANRTLTVLYNIGEHSELAKSIGCLWTDCRIMYAISMGAQ